MSTPEERKTDLQKAIYIVKEACGEDKNAEQYLWMLCEVWRRLDDIYDQDVDVTREQTLEVIEILFLKLPTNVFFIRHQDVLLSQHLSMWNAWEASNKWENGDDTEKIYSHVWRYTIHEVIPIVALLTQGYDKMKTISIEVRKLFKTNLGEE